MVIGSLSGPITETFSTLPTLEIEYEKFRDRKESFILYGVIAIDQESAKTQYAYTGYGHRYYFKKSRAYPVVSSEESTMVEIRPKWRYYYNWDVGLSTVLVQQVNETFDAVSTMLDFGGGIGANYKITKRLSAEANGRMSYGYGFSSVAVNALLIKMSFGVTYFF